MVKMVARKPYQRAFRDGIFGDSCYVGKWVGAARCPFRQGI